MNRLVAIVVTLWISASLALIGCIATAGPPPLPPAPAAPLLWIDDPANGGWWVQKPPVRFMRGQGSALVIFTAPDQVARLCGNPEAQACATRVDGVPVPVVVMPDPCAGFAADRFGQLACHENSHAFGGWKHEVA